MLADMGYRTAQHEATSHRATNRALQPRGAHVIVSPTPRTVRRITAAATVLIVAVTAAVADAEATRPTKGS